MAGLYIHIPFCKSRCIYCGFYSTTDSALRQSYINALCKEAEVRSKGAERRIETLYLGGGTPSQLSASQLLQLFTSIRRFYDLSPEAEITVEVNPDDVTHTLAAFLKDLGVTRISMGVQTFDDQRLAFLRRRHRAEQIHTAMSILRDVGFDNISIDLMYGFPYETLKNWQSDIDAALALDVEHISAYCLMIEENTPLQHMNIEPADEELERQMYEMLIDRLTEAGYKHYELSNFSRPGCQSRHNISYWKDIPYIGLGAAAHSYDGHNRMWNVSDIRQYIEGMEQGKPISDGEELDVDTRYNDRVTVALRTCEGLCLDELSERHRSYLLDNASRYIDDGLLRLSNNTLRLTRKGLFVSDMVMADLMLV